MVGLFMNMLFLFYAERKYHHRDLAVPYYVVDSIEYLGYMQGATSLMLIILYIISKKQIVVKKAWRDFTKLNSESNMTLMTND